MIKKCLPPTQSGRRQCSAVPPALPRAFCAAASRFPLTRKITPEFLPEAPKRPPPPHIPPFQLPAALCDARKTVLSFTACAFLSYALYYKLKFSSCQRDEIRILRAQGTAVRLLFACVAGKIFLSKEKRFFERILITFLLIDIIN